MIKIKRVYDKSSVNDGYRILVDRFYPRGLSKEKANYRQWIKELFPSAELIKWYHSNPEKRWTEFQKRYREELRTNDKKELLNHFIQFLRTKKNVTLLYGSKEPIHNNAYVLLQIIKRRL